MVNLAKFLIILSLIAISFCNNSIACEVIITIPYNQEQEAKLYEAVATGHQPWRLDPVAVSKNAIAAYFQVNIDNIFCDLITKTDSESDVQCIIDKKIYNVHLKKYFGKESLWTATKINIFQCEYCCPVCGYELDFLPWDGDLPSDEICPSCGIQFGYTDSTSGGEKERVAIYKEYRDYWIKKGMLWNSAGRERPPNWKPKRQLQNIGIFIQ